MNVLVVGGAGYIGSHMVKMLSLAGHDVVTLDNLSGGYRDAILYGEFIEADLADRQALNSCFSSKRFDAVMHFASYIEVGESVRNPDKYYENNVTNTRHLLDAMVEHGVKIIIFSSTAAIFGNPDYIPIDEKHNKSPINPYGMTKLIVEQMLQDYDNAYGLKSVSLRYFNAAGADPDSQLGERHDPETHLIPLVLQAASGRRDKISIFGDDYDTPDGSCVRDYIHVVDLCKAHLSALEQLAAGGNSAAYNLGNGTGFSVKEVIEVARQVTGKPIPASVEPRRPGDPAVLVADAALARDCLSWQPEFPELEKIVLHAWNWERKHFLGEIV